MSDIYLLPHNCQIQKLDKIYEKYFPEKNYKGLFVDVGAYDGYNFSNTYPLLINDWHGIAFEPNPEMFTKCYKLYKKYRSRVLNLAVGDSNKKITLHLAGTLSTTSDETLDKYKQIEWAKDLANESKSIEVKQVTLDNALENYTAVTPDTIIDVMSIDTEGTEDKVLAGLSKYKVKMFIIETHEFAKEQELNIVDKVENYLFEYNKIYSDEINSIYVRKGI